MPMAQWAIVIWPSIVKYIVESMKKPKSKIPTCDLVIPKLDFLVCVAKQLQSFLIKCQFDWPMITFLTMDLGVVFYVG